MSEPATGGQEQPAPQQQPHAPEIMLNDRNAQVVYANLVGVRFNPEELILDFAFNPSVLVPGRKEVAVTHRVVLSLVNGKRFLNTLAMALQRHEARFGAIETEPNRRGGPATNLFGAPLPPEGGAKS